jgi:hypothetical protein
MGIGACDGVKLGSTGLVGSSVGSGVTSARLQAVNESNSNPPMSQGRNLFMVSILFYKIDILIIS